MLHVWVKGFSVYSGWMGMVSDVWFDFGYGQKHNFLLALEKRRRSRRHRRLWLRQNGFPNCIVRLRYGKYEKIMMSTYDECAAAACMTIALMRILYADGRMLPTKSSVRSYESIPWGAFWVWQFVARYHLSSTNHMHDIQTHQMIWYTVCNASRMNECERTNNGLNNYVVNLLRLLQMMLDLRICYHRVSLGKIFVGKNRPLSLINACVKM